jgi:DNA-directed RNA polymerase specialized sigma54-like protein
VFQRIIKVLQELDPSGLAARDFLWLAEVLEILVVGADTNRMLSTKEERAATFEAKDHAQQFLIVCIVVGFCRK